ncbi:Protein catecholamines up [Sarcoptes scabiei]|uniref:Histidine-rich membrane protein KE4 -like protein 1 n=1 Tax=Sarcoptes scabiei TaxID=52283 RepID=A0A834RCH7_SARSC|nr:Protein catecholamines up [Sarcoptes scabiei]
MDQLQSHLLQLKNMKFNEKQLAYGSTILISWHPLSFASGGLLGDAFLHLIPHSMNPHHHHGGDGHHHHNHHHHPDNDDHGDHHDHDHHHNDHDHDHKDHDHHHQTMVGLYIIIGIVLFFIIEKFVHIIKDDSHHHHHHKLKEKLSDTEEDDDEKKDSEKKKLRKKQKNVSQSRLVSGILNLIADFLHNLTDGLAIGATFAAGGSMGAITAFTILMHEIPHEIGALIGTFIGLHYGGLDYATQIILPITAGGFIYIATVSIVPELLEGKISHLQSFYELTALFIGVAMMYWIALNE